MITVNIAANVVIAIWLIVDWEAYAMGGYAIGILIGSAISCYFVYVVNLYRVQVCDPEYISHLFQLNRFTNINLLSYIYSNTHVKDYELISLISE